MEVVEKKSIDKIKIDFHIHTNYTDGRDSVKEIVKEARRKRLNAIGFSEHVRKDSPWFIAYLNEVKTFSQQSKDMKIYCGIEARTLNLKGELNASSFMIDNSDFIIASIHRWPLPRFSIKSYTKLIVNTIKNNKINILGHPCFIFGRRITLSIQQIKIIGLTAKEKNVAIEINSSKKVPPEEFLSICNSIGTKFSLGSDAHRKEEVGNIEWSLSMIEKLGIDKKSIIKSF